MTSHRLVHLPPPLTPELARLTQHFLTRPGADPALRAEFASATGGAGGPLPPDYLAFMAHSNGGLGPAGEQGLWLRLDRLEDVLPSTRGQGAPPGLLLIGGTRLGEALAIDTRPDADQPRPGGARVVTVSLGWWAHWEALDVLGNSLEAALGALEHMGRSDRPWSPLARPSSGPRPAIGFVPTPQPVVEAMLAAAGVQRGERVVDLGCGDGRIVITAARKFGARGLGYDLDFELIQAARAGAAAAGVRHAATFQRADIFTVDLAAADVVTLYLLRDINARLLPQLLRLRPGARVVSYEFGLPGYPPTHTELVDYAPGLQGRLFVWQAPLRPG